jgi:hypothetical protein
MPHDPKVIRIKRGRLLLVAECLDLLKAQESRCIPVSAPEY